MRTCRGGRGFVLLVALALGGRGGQTFVLVPSCSRTFATATGCTGGRTSGRALACTGGRTCALALRRGQSTILVSRTTGWRCLGVVGLGSGVAGVRSGTRSGSRGSLPMLSRPEKSIKVFLQKDSNRIL